MPGQSGNPFFLFRQRMSERLAAPEAILTAFATGPEDLDRALAGLSEPNLDLARGSGKWTIRQIVHHVVDGDTMWGMCVRVAMGSPGSIFRLDWYNQDPWVDALGHTMRPIAPALELLRASRRHVVQLLEYLPDAWEQGVLIPRPDYPDGFEMIVKDIILTQAVHIPWHVEQIRETRQMHGA
jgi:hypothetical protein